MITETPIDNYVNEFTLNFFIVGNPLLALKDPSGEKKRTVSKNCTYTFGSNKGICTFINL